MSPEDPNAVGESLAKPIGESTGSGNRFPLVVAYISVVKVDPFGLLLSFGAATQSAQTAVILPATIYAAGLATGLIWLVAFGPAREARRLLSVVFSYPLRLFLSASVSALFGLLAQPVLGVILFLTGAQLALGSCDFSKIKGERFITLATTAFAVWNVGLAFVVGLTRPHREARPIETVRNVCDRRFCGIRSGRISRYFFSDFHKVI